MTEIIPIGMRGKKIIPVGTKRECTRLVLVEVPVGLIAEKAARSFRSRCRPVLKCVVNRKKRPCRSFGGMGIVRKEHSKGGIMLLSTRKDMRRFRRGCSDV